MDRRKFIKNTASFISLPILLNGQALQVLGANGIYGPEATNGKVLVLIQLDGGNDGLNTLIPLDMYANLANARPQIILPENKILRLTDTQGLHPSMADIKNLFDEEKFMFIQNVGYPQPNLSHFRSKEIILSASDSQTVVSSGWFGRYLEFLHPEYPEDYPSGTNPHPLAITIGNSDSPSCQGNLYNMGVVLQNLNSSYESQSGTQTFPDTPYGYELEYITQVMKNTEKYLEVVSEAADLSESTSAFWPENNSLANKLKIVARLIAGGLHTPVYVVNLGGFDTHANQVVTGETETGNHANLMSTVSQAIFAFQDELKIQHKEDNVIGLVYSEFGRRIASNKSNGTDHGEAYPMMLFGSRINPVVYGNNPDIPEEVESKANVKMDLDFRSIYASILKYWFEIEETEVSNILLNNFDVIPILKSAVNVNQIQTSEKIKISSVYPIPVTSTAIIRFVTQGGQITLTLVDTNGKQVQALLNSNVPSGLQQITFSRNGLPSGQYFLVLQNKSERFSQPIIIQ